MYNLIINFSVHITIIKSILLKVIFILSKYIIKILLSLVIDLLRYCGVN